jgi:hypothetical protein
MPGLEDFLFWRKEKRHPLFYLLEDATWAYYTNDKATADKIMTRLCLLVASDDYEARHG